MSVANHAGLNSNPAPAVATARDTKRRASMFLEGNVDFSKYVPRATPISTKQIREARRQTVKESSFD